jgi:hypothetical protein
MLQAVAKKKNSAAVMLGRLGGKARARSLTPEERSQSARKAGKSRIHALSAEERAKIAKLAAQARWSKKK